MAFVVLDNPPAGLDFGVDTFSWTTGPNFKGLSLIPKGLHFFYHSTGLGARQGFFIEIGAKDEVTARNWIASTEEISSKSTLNRQQVQSLADAIRRGDFNSNLGPYPFDQHRTWRNLTNLINDDVLSKAGCSPGSTIIPGDAADVSHLLDRDGKTLEPYLPDAARVAKWSDIKGIEASIREGIISSGSMDETSKAERLSALHIDRSAIVYKLAETAHNGRLLGVLGELQLSFVLFLILYSHSAMKQWMLCVDLICNSEQALLKDLQFTQYFLRLLYEQLNFIPLDFFSDELSKDNFLGPAMYSLFSALNPATERTADSLPTRELNFLKDEVVVDHRNRLKSFLTKKFGIFEQSPLTLKTIRLYQDKLRNNVALDASDRRELLGSVGSCGGTAAEDDLPAIVSLDIDEEIAPSNHSSDTSLFVPNIHVGPFPSSAQAEKDLTSSHNMLDKWGAQLDQSFASAAVTREKEEEKEAITRMEDVPTENLAMDRDMSPKGSDALSDADADIGSGHTDIEPPEESPMTNSEIEIEKYCWRYPFLYASMRESLEKGVQEDFVMVCARVLEEQNGDSVTSSSSSYNQTKMSPLAAEALLFLEEELRAKK